MNQPDHASGHQAGTGLSKGGAHLPRAARAVTTLLTGRLVSRTGAEDLCRIRNISAAGMLVETTAPILIADEIAVELKTGERLVGEVIWARPGRLGVRLETPIDVERILETNARSASTSGTTRPRAPRFAAGCTARVTSAGHSCNAIVDNLSQSGARLKLSRALPLASPLTLAIPGLTARRCAVRWNEGVEVGLAFLDVIPFAELSAWLQQCRSGDGNPVS